MGEPEPGQVEILISARPAGGRDREGRERPASVRSLQRSPSSLLAAHVTPRGAAAALSSATRAACRRCEGRVGRTGRGAYRRRAAEAGIAQLTPFGLPVYNFIDNQLPA
jgi:hypothetical protein